MQNNQDIKLSIIMIDGSFRNYFHSINSFGNQTLPQQNYELIWVEYYNKVKPELEQLINNYQNFRIIKLNKTGEYHSSYCFNAGIESSRGNLLVIPDADIIVEDYFLEEILNEHNNNEHLAMYIYRYNQLENTGKDDFNIEELKKVCVLNNPSNYGGCLTVRRKWLLEINGYEQHPIFSTGFHANGLDIYTRLKIIGLSIKWHPTLKLYHPWHPNTLTNSPSYNIQRQLINIRAKTLDPLAIQGIDSSIMSKITEDKINEHIFSNSIKERHKKFKILRLLNKIFN